VIEHLLTENISINEQNFCLKFNHFLKRKKYISTTKYQIVIEAFAQIQKKYNFHLEDCEISIITKKFPKKLFLLDFDSFLANTIFIVNCDASCSENAFHKAMQAINLCRAIIHISQESKWKMDVEESLFKPFNPIMLGKHYYVLEENIGHIKRFKRVNFSYDSSSQSEIKLTAKAIKGSLEIISKLDLIKASNTNYYYFLTGSLVQLIKALETLDLTNALPLMWGAIETILKKVDGDKYDVLIERCSSLYSNKFKVKNLLTLIKEHRNNFVHNGKENIKLTKLFLIELEKIHRDLFYFHLNNALSGGTFEKGIQQLSS
ncbi:TPA: hypothetical protein P5L96_002382, partial [Legionella pneumophila]|nr:hypothetical protein [Legionella pneumophila]